MRVRSNAAEDVQLGCQCNQESHGQSLIMKNATCERNFTPVRQANNPRTPEEMEENIRQFEEQFKAKYGGRKWDSDPFVDPKPLPWPDRFRRIFQTLQVSNPPPLHRYQEYNFHAVEASGYWEPDKERILITPGARGMSRDFVLIHEIGHSVEKGRMPADWQEQIEKTERNRLIRQREDAPIRDPLASQHTPSNLFDLIRGC